MLIVALHTINHPSFAVYVTSLNLTIASNMDSIFPYLVEVPRILGQITLLTYHYNESHNSIKHGQRFLLFSRGTKNIRADHTAHISL
jgi:hypothetical protein